MIEALSLPDPVRLAGAGAGLLAAIGLLLLIPLFLSQYRDVRRIRAWRVLEPERGDAAAPIGPTGAPVQPTAFGPAPAPLPGPGATLSAQPATATQGAVTAAGAHAATAAPVTDPTTPDAPSTPSPAGRVMTPAERVTADRPALERITMDSPAVEPETGVHKIWTRVREPRHPLWIAAGTLLIGAGIFIGVLQLVVEQPSDSTGPVGNVTPAEVEVAVLNASDDEGLADNVSDDIEANGYTLGSTGDSERNFNRTTVMFREGQRVEARSVAQALGVQASDVRPISNAVARGVQGADVVVLAGEDRVRL